MIPHHWYPSAECGQIYEATVTATLCNDNPVGSGKNIELFKGEDKNSYVKIKNQEVPFDKNIIPAGECITVTKVMDQKKCKNTPIGVQLQGNMPSLNGNSFCYSYIYNKARSKAIPEPTIITPAPTYTEECDTVGETSGNVCRSSVSINCEYDGDKSCIGPNEQHLFYNIPLDECLANPIQNVRVQQSMCNNNQNNAIDVILDKSYFRYRGDDDVAAVPSELAAGACATSDRQGVTINTCRRNNPMSVQLSGRMRDAPNTGNAFCYCYMFKNGLMEQYPTQSPPEPPREDPKKPTIAFLTEIVDPKGKDAMRYIEIYSPNKKGKEIKEAWSLVRYVGSSTSYERESAVVIQGLKFNKDGYIVLCRNEDKYEKCHKKTNAFKLLFDKFLPGLNSGVNFAIIDTEKNDAVVDVYGTIGTDPTMGFIDGRVYRAVGVETGSSTYSADEWVEEKGYYDSATPGCWIGADDLKKCRGKPKGKGTKKPSTIKSPKNTSAPGSGNRRRRRV